MGKVEVSGPRQGTSANHLPKTDLVLGIGSSIIYCRFVGTPVIK